MDSSWIMYLSVEIMVRELGVVTDYQIAEYLLQHDNLTLGFDPTTQEGVSIKEVFALWWK